MRLLTAGLQVRVLLVEQLQPGLIFFFPGFLLISGMCEFSMRLLSRQVGMQVRVLLVEQSEPGLIILSGFFVFEGKQKWNSLLYSLINPRFQPWGQLKYFQTQPFQRFPIYLKRLKPLQRITCLLLPTTEVVG